MKKLFYSLLVLVALSAVSCTSYKNIPYFANISDSATVHQKGEDIPAAVYAPIKVKVDDVLSIVVTSIDPQAGATEAINAISMANRTVTATNNPQAFNNNIQGYLVDKNGEIELPLIGTVKVAGLTTNEIKEAVKKKAAVYFKEPTVNVRVLNFRVTVLGEVNRPGTYSVSNERVSVLDALGLAGDLTIYGKRENILVLREGDNNKKAVRFNLNDARIIGSPYFYLQQNDVVYVEPVKNKAIQSDAATTRTISIVTGAASILAVVAAAIIR